jgi:hypothetical protein
VLFWTDLALAFCYAATPIRENSSAGFPASASALIFLGVLVACHLVILKVFIQLLRLRVYFAYPCP